ncbi:MAG: MAPEG family protein, partial [Pikeienuella sp.]
HKNAVENLVVFAPLVLAAHIVGTNSEMTATAAMVYFLARLVHYVVYVMAVPVVRTLAFAVGWLCQMIFGLAIIGVV